MKQEFWDLHEDPKCQDHKMLFSTDEIFSCLWKSAFSFGMMKKHSFLFLQTEQNIFSVSNQIQNYVIWL